MYSIICHFSERQHFPVNFRDVLSKICMWHVSGLTLVNVAPYHWNLWKHRNSEAIHQLCGKTLSLQSLSKFSKELSFKKSRLGFVPSKSSISNSQFVVSPRISVLWTSESSHLILHMMYPEIFKPRFPSHDRCFQHATLNQDDRLLIKLFTLSLSPHMVTRLLEKPSSDLSDGFCIEFHDKANTSW
jgi:hypothetical protein